MRIPNHDGGLYYFFKQARGVHIDRKGYKDIQKSASRNTAKDPQPKERLNIFVRNIHEGVYETGVHGNFTYFNKALCRILGLPEEVKRHRTKKSTFCY